MVSSSIKRRRRSVDVEKRREVPRGGRHQTDICERPQICIGMTRVAGERWADHRVKVTEEALSLAIAYWRAGDTTRAHLFDHTHSIFIDATLRLDVRCRDRL